MSCSVLIPAERSAAVLEAARDVGFDDVGIARADAPLFGVEELTSASAQKRLQALPWLEGSIEARADIQSFLPGARSVVVVVVNYHRGERPEGEGALVSRYAWGADYHNLVRKKLRKLRKRLLRELDGNAQWAPFNDVDAVLERAWAAAAGLGFIGKSTLFIHRRLGTWTFLGGLVTDLPLKPTGPEGPPTDLCGRCRRCLEA